MKVVVIEGKAASVEMEACEDEAWAFEVKQEFQ